MTQQRRLTTEFEDEVIRLARISGRTQREVVEDLGHFTHRDPSLIKSGNSLSPCPNFRGHLSWPFPIPR